MLASFRICHLFELFLTFSLWEVSLARPRSSPTERSTSRSYFSRCGKGSSSNLERLSSAVPIKKLLASFDISTNVAFFRLESCSSYSICFITKTKVITKKDFGAPNTVLWSKLVKEYQGKKPAPFSEVKHRRIFARSKLEDSCLHGFYVIGKSADGGSSNVQKDSSPASLLTQGELRRDKKRRKKKRKPRRNNSKRQRNRHKRRKQGNRKRSAQGCKRDEEFCVRRCIAWNNGDCVRLQISCSFLCPSSN
ncbi:uncharacterized protein LOC135695461 isoform X2 [Rhopilema esculentum]|uniref:uncharacterized protein LOC135695461 isoform X2 n=1 Tax=Rhopilema esculentum TaxID=499914 RepID=UPI0031DCED05